MLCHCGFRYGQVDLLCRVRLRSETGPGNGEEKLAHLWGYAGLKSIALCERRHRFGFCCSPRIMPFLWGTGSHADGRGGGRLNKCSSCVNAVIAGIDIENRDYRNNVARAVGLHCGAVAMRMKSIRGFMRTSLRSWMLKTCLRTTKELLQVGGPGRGRSPSCALNSSCNRCIFIHFTRVVCYTNNK